MRRTRSLATVPTDLGERRTRDTCLRPTKRAGAHEIVVLQTKGARTKAAAGAAVVVAAAAVATSERTERTVMRWQMPKRWLRHLRSSALRLWPSFAAGHSCLRRRRALGGAGGGERGRLFVRSMTRHPKRTPERTEKVSSKRIEDAGEPSGRATSVPEAVRRPARSRDDPRTTACARRPRRRRGRPPGRRGALSPHPSRWCRLEVLHRHRAPRRRKCRPHPPHDRAGRPVGRRRVVLPPPRRCTHRRTRAARLHRPSARAARGRASGRPPL